METSTLIGGEARRPGGTGNPPISDLLRKAVGVACLLLALSLAAPAPAQGPSEAAPVLLTQPESQSVVSGSTVSFSVTASGTAPLFHQWRFHGTNLLGVTNTTLLLTNVNLLRYGPYSVVVSNSFGAVTSQVATLRVDEHLFFRILELRTNRFSVLEVNSITGDDRGGMAVSSNAVFLTGDTATGRWESESLTNGVSLGRRYVSLVSDLLTETVYSLAAGTNHLVVPGGTVSNLLQLDAAGNLTGTRINLSRPIPLFGDYGWQQSGIFAGYGRIVLHNRTNVFNIDLPSGVVTDLGAMPEPVHTGTESYAYWGLAEYAGGSIYLIYVRDSQTIVRIRVPDGTTTTVASFVNLSDMASITFSTSLSRWYFHYEGSAQFRSGDESLGSAKAAFTVNPDWPVITRDPTNQTAYPGTAATFRVEASGGAPLRYQWWFNGQPLEDATGETLVLPEVQESDAGAYLVEVRNDVGVAVSAPAWLDVVSSPRILLQPVNRTVYPGANVTFNVVADGAPPLSYQWRFNDLDLDGATNASLTLTNVQPAQGGIYTLLVFNLYGSVASAPAVLTVRSSPILLTEPQDRVVYPGSNATFSVVADGAPPLFYQWRFNGTNLANATNASLTLTNVVAAQAGFYSVVVSNSYGTITSRAAELTVIRVVDDGSVFQITSLTTNGCRVVDHNSLTGDDRGGIAVSSNYVFYTGDNRTARYLLDDLTSGSTIGTARYDSMVSNLRTETVYLLASGTNLVVGTDYEGTVDTLLELTAAGTLSGNRIPLSRPIRVGGSYGGRQTGLFAGYERILIHNRTNVFSIALPSGVVTDLGPMPEPTHVTTENWAYWGIAEFFGGSVYLLYVRDWRTIVRTRIPDGATFTVASFSNLSDMAVLTISLSRQRWYFHHEYSSQFGGSSETLGYCNATFVINSGPNAASLAWNPIPSPQAVSTPFQVTLTARTTSGVVATNYQGSVSLSGLSLAGTPLAVSPTVISNFVNGVWTGPLTVFQPTTGMVVRAEDLAGNAGVSVPFSVSFTNDLVVRLGAAPDPVLVGSPLTYSIQITNTGAALSTGLILSNTLPPGVTFLSASTPQGACTNLGGLVRCDLGTLPGLTGLEVTIQVTAPTLGSLTNRVTVVRNEPDPDLSNNSAVVISSVTLPLLHIEDASLVEGDAGTNQLVFTVWLSAPGTNPVSVTYYTANGTAVSTGNFPDYLAASDTLVFPPGVTTQTVTILVRGDTLFEANETFFVNLITPVNGSLGRSQGVGTIFNDDLPPLVSVSDVSLVEGNAGTNNAVFQVRLLSPSGLPVVIQYATSNGTATAGSDYVSRSGTLAFSAGTAILTQNVAIQVLGDTLPEPDETFSLHLYSISNGVAAKAVGIGTILNDDALGVLHHFNWRTLESPQPVGEPIPVTVSARDISENLVSNFTGTVSLGAISVTPPVTNLLLGSIVYTGGESADRTVGYAFTPHRTLRVTHLRHYFGSKVSLWTDTGLLLASQNVSSLAGTWRETVLTNPVTLTAGTRYRLGVQTGPLIAYWTENAPGTFADGTFEEAYTAAGDAFPDTPDPGRRWLVDLRYTAGGIETLQVTPTVSPGFTNGLWTGTIAVLQAAANVTLLASNAPGILGTSNPFEVAAPSQADLAVSLAASAGFVPIPDTFTCSLRVTNRGPGSAFGLTLNLPLPAGLSLVSATASQGVWTNAGGAASWTLGSLASRGSASASLLLRAEAQNTNVCRATVSASQTDPDPSNNSAAVTVTSYRDADRDGLWDDWEERYGLNPANPLDADDDSDNDGHSNREEFFAGTDPRDPASVLRLNLTLDGRDVRLRVRGVQGRTYRLERLDGLSGQAWMPVLDFSVGSAENVMLLDTPPPGQSTRFYRVRLLP